MPKESSIGVSKATLKLVKDFQEEINAKSLEEAVKLAVGWARGFNSNMLVSQVELENRLSVLEDKQKSSATFMVNLLNIVVASDNRVKKLENKNKGKNE